MHARSVKRDRAKIELQMTPMIDIVFQLLVFFIMTFQITALEGDFHVKMPLASAADRVEPIDPTVPMTIALKASANGNVDDIRVNDERSFRSFDELHRYIVGTVGSEGGPTDGASKQQATIDADYELRWGETIAAVTAISGYRDEDDAVVRLIENVKFMPQEGAGG